MVLLVSIRRLKAVQLQDFQTPQFILLTCSGGKFPCLLAQDFRVFLTVIRVIWKWPARRTGLEAKTLWKHATALETSTRRSKTFVQKSHDGTKVKWLQNSGGPMEVAIVTNRPVAYCSFHTFTVFLHLNLYSDKTNYKQKRSTFFTKKKKKKKKMQWLQYTDREKQQLNSYISLTN